MPKRRTRQYISLDFWSNWIMLGEEHKKKNIFVLGKHRNQSKKAQSKSWFATMASKMSFPKIEKLSRPADFIPRRRRVQAILSREHPTLKCIQRAPTHMNSTSYEEWQLCNAREKSTIVICLEHTALAETHGIVDNETKNALKPWEELARMYLTSSTQAAANFQEKPEAMNFKDGEGWNQHVCSPLLVVDELSARDQVISDKKVT